MAKMKNALGKGLGALIPSQVAVRSTASSETSVSHDDGQSVGVIALIDITRIRPNPLQPREDFDPQALDDLKKSIKEKGVIQPITVRRTEYGYEIIAGERRVRASMEIGMAAIPAYILDITTDAEMLELALIENVQREHLNPVEIALGYQRLIEECRLTQEEVSQKVGKDRTTVTNFLRLLRLPREIQYALRQKRISMGHARAMLAITDAETQVDVFRRVVQDDLSVRRTEELVKLVAGGRPADVPLGPKKNAPSPFAPVPEPAEPRTETKFYADSAMPVPELPEVEDDPRVVSTLDEIENRLRQLLATQVHLRMKKEGSGSLEIRFFSPEELERLLDLFAIIERSEYAQ